MEPAQSGQVQQLGHPSGSTDTKSKIRQLLQSTKSENKVSNKQNKMNQLTYLIC